MHVTAARSGSSLPNRDRQELQSSPNRAKERTGGVIERGERRGQQQPQTESFVSRSQSDLPGKKAKAEVGTSHFRDGRGSREEERKGGREGAGALIPHPLS